MNDNKNNNGVEESKEVEKNQSVEAAATIIKTDEGEVNGQEKCPKCGSTDISMNKNTGKLRCNFCRHEFEPEKVSGFETDISKLEGQVIASGATRITSDDNVVTLKCSSCGAEVVIDTTSSTQARCHWCRNTLSINEQIPNGAVPDVVLPFSVKREDARASIEKFVGKRKFFAHPKFRREFTTENIMGVYFPYMLVDINAHASFSGEGEHETRSYYVGSDEHREKRYDADLYHVEREFDIAIKGLSVESSSDRLNNSSKEKTNNIINAIMPFDVENVVKYNANYLRGFTSEKRDTSIDDLKELVDTQGKDIARFAANDTLKKYDRGVKWNSEELKIKGQQWKAAYLPVWLYSYQEVTGSKKLLHYVAVNARTNETMGSVPIHMPKLIAVSAFIELLGFLAMLFVDFDYKWAFLLAGVIYFFIMYFRYRNSNARHTYEKETKREVSNLRNVDAFIRSRHGLRSAWMDGANNRRVEGTKVNSNIIKQIASNKTIDNLTSGNVVADMIKDKIKKKDGE